MKKELKKSLLTLIFAMIICVFAGISAFAATDTSSEQSQTAVMTSQSAREEDNTTGSKAIAAAVCVGLVAASGAIGMALAISKSVEGISRQPEAEGKIRTSLMLGLVFIETAIIYALIVAILVIFVL